MVAGFADEPAFSGASLQALTIGFFLLQVLIQNTGLSAGCSAPLYLTCWQQSQQFAAGAGEGRPNEGDCCVFHDKNVVGFFGWFPPPKKNIQVFKS